MHNNKIPPIVAVGTVAYDTVESPFGKAEHVLGGSGMYFAAAASILSPVNLVAVVGEDFSQESRDEMKNPNLDLGGMATHPGKTFSWGGTYRNDINIRDTDFTELGVIENWVPEVPEAYRACKTVCLANIDPPAQLEVLKAIEDPGLVVLDTMNLWIDVARDSLLEVIGLTDVLILNDEEARQLTGELNLPTAIEKIQDLGPSIVVVKKGEHGAMLAQQGEDGNEIFSLPGLPLKTVCDPTGAGDCFAGGFVGYIQRSGISNCRSNDTLRTAVAYGSAAASFCCEDFSARRLRGLTIDDLEQRVDSFRRLVDF